MSKEKVVYDNGNSGTKLTDDGELIRIIQHVQIGDDQIPNSVILYHDEAEILQKEIKRILNKKNQVDLSKYSCYICGEKGNEVHLVKCQWCGNDVCEEENCIEMEDVGRDETICKACYWR